MSHALLRAPTVAAPRAEPPATPGALVAIVDISIAGQRLLSATLFALGCRIMPIDCQADSGGAIAVQIRAGAPHVVIWQLDAAQETSSGTLVSLLASGLLSHAGVVVVSTAPEDTARLLADSRVQVLASPFTAVTLMAAVRRAIAARPPARRGVDMVG